MKYIEGISRHQIVLYPEMLDDLVTDDNPVRVIDVFVDGLNLHRLGFTNANLDPSDAGRPAYPPGIMLKLFIYGYFKKIRSSRKLMELCLTNIEVMWLTGRLTPDFHTIANFRKDNAKVLKQVFKLFVRVCAEMGLYGKEIGVQDGSKFRAANSKDKNLTRGKLEKKLAMIDENIDRYINEMGKADSEDGGAQTYTKEEIAEKLKNLKDRKSDYMDMLERMNNEGLTQISLTDPDSRLMKSNNGGFDVSYNTQITVDPESHMIGAFEVTNHGNDMGCLTSVTTQLKETIGVDVIEVVADKGYEDHADMLECLENGTIPHVMSKSGADAYEFELGYEKADISEEIIDSQKPEDIKTCLRAGVLPSVYKGKGIDISVEEMEVYGTDESDDESNFKLNDDGTAVICPNGSELGRVARLHGKGKTRYVNKAACAKCNKKCTSSAFKQVDLKDDQAVMATKKKQTVKKVKIRLRPDEEKLKNRKCVVEHPFGTVKRWMDGSYILLKGLEKAGADLALLFLSYNIKRAISMVGTKALVEGMREVMGRVMESGACSFSFLHAFRVLAAKSHPHRYLICAAAVNN